MKPGEANASPDAVFLRPLPMFARDAEILTDELHRGNAPEADNDLRAQQPHLLAQVADARLLLDLQRVTVVRRTAFDDVGDVAVFRAVKVNDRQHVVQQPTCRTDERLAAQVLLLARTFAHEQHARGLAADAEHDVRARLAEGAGGAGTAACPEQFKAIHHHSSRS